MLIGYINCNSLTQQIEAMPKKWTGGRIRELRERLGLTQTEMAERLGYAHYTAVLRLEKGEREASGPVAKLLDVLEKEAEGK